VFGSTNAKNGFAVTFKLSNSGTRPGAEVTEVYAGLPAGAGEPPKRLVGWSKIKLAPGESKEVTVPIDPLYISVFDVGKNAWQVLPGSYAISVGSSSRDLPLHGNIVLK